MNLLISPVLATVAASGEDAPLDLSGHAASSHAAGGGNLVRTIVGLAIVLAVIFGLRWVLKQVKASREEKASGHGLSGVATLPLGSNRSLHVVRAGREVLVVGSGEHGVTPVRTYNEAEAHHLGILDPTPAKDAAPTGRFPWNSHGNRPVELGGEPLRPLPEAGERGVVETLRAWTVRG